MLIGLLQSEDVNWFITRT